MACGSRSADDIQIRSGDDVWIKMPDDDMWSAMRYVLKLQTSSHGVLMAAVMARIMITTHVPQNQRSLFKVEFSTSAELLHA